MKDWFIYYVLKVDWYCEHLLFWPESGADVFAFMYNLYACQYNEKTSCILYYFCLEETLKKRLKKTDWGQETVCRLGLTAHLAKAQKRKSTQLASVLKWNIEITISMFNVNPFHVVSLKCLLKQSKMSAQKAQEEKTH